MPELYDSTAAAAVREHSHGLVLQARLPSPSACADGSGRLALAIAIAVPAGVASGQEQGIDRSVIPVAPDAPQRYIVQPGDTLWDISAKFLTDPWYWPEIWHINPQVANPHLIYPGDELALTWVDGQPRVSLASGGEVRLSPRVREHPLSEAIHAIPYERIAAFMSRPEAARGRGQVEGAPYVVAARDERLIASVGNDIYVRRLDGRRGRQPLQHLPRRRRAEGSGRRRRARLPGTVHGRGRRQALRRPGDAARRGLRARDARGRHPAGHRPRAEDGLHPARAQSRRSTARSCRSSTSARWSPTTTS